MPTVGELFFGRIAVKNGMLTPDQVREAVRRQEGIRLVEGKAPPLGELLLADGLLTREQVDQVLEAQRLSRTIAKDSLYGRLAVRNGLIREEDLQTCLEIQQEERGKRRLGQILVAEGYLNRQQLEAVLRTQARIREEEEQGQQDGEQHAAAD